MEKDCAHIDQHRRRGRNLAGKPSNEQNIHQLEHIQLNLINLTVEVDVSSQDEVTSTSRVPCK